jgi:hypothetical protein
MIKNKLCTVCETSFTPYSSFDKTCGDYECKKQFQSSKVKPEPKQKQKPIAKVSKKRQVEQLKYSVLRVEFLGKPENKKCFIEGCNREANTIEHRAGRWGSNYLDTSTWAGCCSQHNIELENNPELAKEYQLSKIHGGKKL